MIQPGMDTIIVQRAALVNDPVGNRFYRDWDNATMITVNGCSFQRRLTPTEDNRDREYHEAPFVVFTPAWAMAIEPTDRILYQTVLYDVLGVFRWTDRQGQVNHQEVRLELREYT